MSWWVMEQVSVNEAGTQTLANIQCDDVSDLPAPDQSATLGYIIVRGSQAKILATSEIYILGSAGTWVKMEDGVKLDLTGYATEQYVDDGLADKVDTTVYSSGQAVQDAEISTKISLTDVFGLGTALTTGADLNNITVLGIYYAPSTTIASSLVNCPASFTFRMEVKTTNGANRYMQTIYEVSTSTGMITMYIRSYTVNGWQSWYKFEGVQV